MKSFLNYITEAGGASAGKLEIGSTNLLKARVYAERLFKDNDKDLDVELPDFDSTYKKAQQLASVGTKLRKEMPVIDNNDVRVLQKRLKAGTIDISKPFAKNSVPNNPFPDGLDKSLGKEWVTGGLKVNDGDAKDDVVSVSMKKVEVRKLKPIQKQIYFDKSINNIAQFGAKGTRDFATSSSNTFVISSDNRIIDGHHRFLSTMLVDPSIKVNCLEIDLPIKELLPLSLSYSDAIGNKRNA